MPDCYPIRRLTAGVVAFCALMVTGAEPKKKEGGPVNRLAKESSPYLLQHAHNPVDWFPWGPEAFEKAKKEKKLVFLSIGYSSCHWCHVMERESFQDKDVAELLNKNFVCIKVDREERPDIDDIYMTALQVLGSRGGWPLSMFLTADAKPIVGGTYWPKDDRKIGDQTARGFKSILGAMIEFQSTQAKELQQQADEIAARTEESLTQAGRINPLVELNRELADGPLEELKERIDPEHGGFGNKQAKFAGTKFPMPPSLLYMVHASMRSKDAELNRMIDLTLQKMADGGIYDQIGGGFHRYSTERTWTVPHFEKMLYDNAQLVEVYAEVQAVRPNPARERTIRETVAFLRREMTAPTGGFYSALDADSDHKEGEFYVWTPEDLKSVLDNEADVQLIRAVYGVSGSPNFEEKQWVLKHGRPMADVAKDQKLTEPELLAKLTVLKVKLLAARDKRNRPFLDTKVLTAWNGQMIAGLATASKVLKEPEYAAVAAKAADFVLANLRDKEGRLLRTYSKKGDGTFEAKLNAYLDDYAFLVHGLLNLHEVTGDAKWRDAAVSLTDMMMKRHGDSDRGGFFYTSHDHEKLFARPKEFSDGVQPSSNAVAARNLVRLWKLTGQEPYRKAAERTLKQFAGIMKASPRGVPAMADALHLYLDVVEERKKVPAPIVPKPTGPVAPALLKNSADVVKGTARLGAKGDDGSVKIEIELMVEKPWHLYANPVGNESLAESATTATVMIGGKAVDAAITYPKGSEVKDDQGKPYRVYAERATITAVLKGPVPAGDVTVRVKFQACQSGDEARCLLPAGVTLTAR